MVWRQVLDTQLDPTAMRPTAVMMMNSVAAQERFAVDRAVPDQFVRFVGVDGDVLGHGEVVANSRYRDYAQERRIST